MADSDSPVKTDHQTPVTASMRAIGTTAVVAVTEARSVGEAVRLLEAELDAIDVTCSRFRPDSEIQRLQRSEESSARVSSLLFEAMRAALEVAQYTDGAVDPTVGTAIESLGYDRDFELMLSDGGSDNPRRARDERSQIQGSALERAVPGWWMIELDAKRRTLSIPRGVHIDLGATAKALVTDRAAQRIADECGCGVLVSVGGDVAVAGNAPQDGWAVGIALSSATPTNMVDQVVSIEAGGLASSSTSVRRWKRCGHEVHHIIDPATGTSAEPYWHLVSTTGPNCVDANAASTAAIVWGPGAVERLEALGQPARLQRHDGAVITLNGWPEDPSARRPTVDSNGVAKS
jgi:FAD:protein FMN transferase